jgi:microcystin-dependent protein
MVYVGEIRLFGGSFNPAGWMFCDGQLLLINENETLFNLIGTTYGGDGQETFALPDLRSRVPVHQGNGFVLAENGGVEDVTLTVNQIPVHSHALLASANPGSSNSPGGHVTAAPPGIRPYVEDAPTVSLAPGALQPSGGSQPHTNLQPYLCLNFIISLFGEFPSQF